MSSSATDAASATTSAPVGSTTDSAPSVSIVSSTSTVTLPATSTIPGSTLTTTVPISTSTVTTPSSTAVVPSSTPPALTVVTSITSTLTQTPTNPASSGPIITTITSTQPILTISPTAGTGISSTRTSATSSSTQTALSASGSNGGSTSGLSSAATIAIAVIIPIAAVIGLVIFGLWFWRRRKAKKNDEELRKNEMAEYGFNPNHDPTLPVAAAAYTDGGSEGNDDSGYRGWGATTSNRKTSTTLGSNSRAVGGVNGAMSDHGSQGYAPQPSPSNGGSDVMSQDPLVHGYPDATTTGAVGAAALAGGAGGAAAASRSNRYSQVSAPSGIHRGPSNASSAYSGVAHSEASSDVPDMPRPYYEQEIPYNVYNDVQPGQGSYGEGTFGGQNEEPVIRDVSARRNTRIERAPTFPQQGGIAQNF